MRWGLAVVLAALSFVVGGVVGIALDRKHRPKLKNQQRWPSTAADKPPTTDSFQQFYRACRVTFAHNQGAQHKLLQHFEEVFFEAGFDQLRAFALIDQDHDGHCLHSGTESDWGCGGREHLVRRLFRASQIVPQLVE